MQNAKCKMQYCTTARLHKCLGAKQICKIAKFKIAKMQICKMHESKTGNVAPNTGVWFPTRAFVSNSIGFQHGRSGIQNGRSGIQHGLLVSNTGVSRNQIVMRSSKNTTEESTMTQTKLGQNQLSNTHWQELFTKMRHLQLIRRYLERMNEQDTRRVRIMTHKKNDTEPNQLSNKTRTLRVENKVRQPTTEKRQNSTEFSNNKNTLW